MSTTTLLARAHVASTRNHLTAQFGGIAQSNVALAIALAVAVGYNAFMYLGTSSLLGALVGNPLAAELVFPLLPIVLTLPAFGIALILLMLLPIESPLALQARLLGASRWYCAASEFVPVALAISVVSVVGVGGSLVYVAGLSESPAATFVALLALSLVFGLGCITVSLVVERIVGALHGSPRERRLWGVLVAAGVMIALCGDIISRAAQAGTSQNFSPTALIASLWAGGLPDHWSTAALLLSTAIVLFLVGGMLTFADPAGGYLRAGSVAVAVPHFSSFRTNMIAVELASWIREPTSRVSLAAMILIDVALISAARAQVLDHGVVLLLVVVVSATGGELIVGRSRDLNWILRALGVREATILWFRIGVVAVCLTAVFTVVLAAGGLLENPPLRIAEAYSLFLAVFALATLAGTILPFDERAPLGMFATSVVSILLEILVIAAVTTVFRLEGLALVAADLFVVAVAAFLISSQFKKLRLAGV